MTVDEYLQENVDAETLQNAKQFVQSREYQKIQEFTNSDEFKQAKAKLKESDAIIHEDILKRIDAMQNEILQQLE